jgi:GntR family histidine utilization transcriptional repressor
VFHSVMVHLENGVPIQYEDRYVNPQAAPDYLATDFTRPRPRRTCCATRR